MVSDHCNLVLFDNSTPSRGSGPAPSSRGRGAQDSEGERGFARLCSQPLPRRQPNTAGARRRGPHRWLERSGRRYRRSRRARQGRCVGLSGRGCRGHHGPTRRGSAALRQRVEALLRAHDEPDSFLDEPAGALDTTVDAPIGEQPGTRIGPYKLLEQIGEGSFGVVFMAEQTQPIRRTVALKVLKPTGPTSSAPGRGSRTIGCRTRRTKQVAQGSEHHRGSAPAGRDPPFLGRGAGHRTNPAPIGSGCESGRRAGRDTAPGSHREGAANREWQGLTLPLRSLKCPRKPLRHLPPGSGDYPMTDDKLPDTGEERR